jgi:hypothetical protein
MNDGGSDGGPANLCTVRGCGKMASETDDTSGFMIMMDYSSSVAGKVSQVGMHFQLYRWQTLNSGEWSED